VTTRYKESSGFRALGLASLSAVFLAISLGCAAKNRDSESTPATAPAPFTEPSLVPVASGSFIFGSSAIEREYAYQLDELAYGHSRTRTGKWYDSEPSKTTETTSAFNITTTPVTNGQYQQFVNATGHPAPNVDQTTWSSYGLIHPYDRTRRHAWSGNQPPSGRLNHPVVLVSYADATAYASWLSGVTGSTWRLPTEREWEKAARGTEGLVFPWGNEFLPEALNSHDAGPFDTVAVGSRSSPSPFGMLDAAGQVFEWISSSGANRSWVKGGSWDDSGCGVCRPAARHSRPKALKHILIGFRLVKE